MHGGPEGAGLVVRRPGRLPYGEGLSLQRELRDARLAGQVPDTLLLLEHPDVITFGRRAAPGAARLSEPELRDAGYDVHRVDRGGDVTWHGPGQIVGYPIVDLAPRGPDVHAFLRGLEGVIIDVLADFGVEATRRRGYTGVWLDARRKIASIGIGVRRWVTMHGFALNVSCDLERFEAIIPCGLDDVEMVRLADWTSVPCGVDVVMDRIEEHFRAAFE